MDSSTSDMNRDHDSALSSAEKAISLYKFIRDLSALKQKVVLNVADYYWSRSVKSIPNDPQNIEIFYRDRVEDENSSFDPSLLCVHKPEFQKCPEPDDILKEWLYAGWDSFRNEASIHEKIERYANEVMGKPNHSEEVPQNLLVFSKQQQDTDDENTIVVEHFNDDKSRIKAYEKWMDTRNEWVEKQRLTEKTRDLFTSLYKLHVDLERESETLEMVVTNGFLRDRENNGINHPVITRRVKTSFDAASNTMSIEDTDVETELYAMMFQMMADINLDSITSLRDDLRKNDYHPMDRNDMPEFMKVLVHQLSSESLFSKDGEPDGWMRSNRLLLYINPVFIVRKRVDGTMKAIEHIIENIIETGYVPPHLNDIVCGGQIEIPEDNHEETVEEQLAAVGGESVDILLSKEANKEQLEIAQRIELYNAVLVQGPPGTGKTHTIANLMGHFLAQGKSVLVTSHTKKALTVLKEKVAPGLQNLCVSVLDDSNVDMEKSVDGITDYMSKNTAHELRRQMDSVAQERRKIIADLADTRKKLFAIINQECNSIVLNGEEISPSKAAAFLLDRAGDLSYIPGNVRLYSSMPVSFAELADLYRSNESISVQDEPELACDLPNPDTLLSPLEFEKTWQSLQAAKQHLSEIAKTNAWNIQYNNYDCCILFEAGSYNFSFDYPEETNLDSLSTYIESFGSIETWMKYAAIDGKKGGAFKQRWLTLIEQIQRTCDYAESIVTEQFGKTLHFICDEDPQELIPAYEKLRSVLAKKGKISKLDLLFNSPVEKALSSVTINGLQIQSADDCDIVLHTIELKRTRKQCSVYWNDLLSAHDVPSFFDLDNDEPERIAEKWIAPIQRYLNWYKLEFSLLSDHLSDANIPTEVVFSDNSLDSELSATDRILSALNDTVPPIIDVCRTTLRIQKLETAISDTESVLQVGKRINSTACMTLIRAITNGDCSAYTEDFKQLEALYEKYDLQQKRDDLLLRIAPVAPQWADAIKNRIGIHGDAVVPITIEDAWKWKQYSGIISNITAEPFDELQARSIFLSKKYRQVTAKYAEKSAWYYLLSRTERDIDMKQALQGWKQTVKRIGKGTGKNAPMYKAKARELMAKCQTAVPGWIMPINRALESLDPRTNSFDIIIVDEASQSDISALAIVYMAKKLIIVGDDKQVSPMAVGVEIDKMNALEQMYIKGKIPNSHLYNAKTSLYDIAATTFQPLMLREHFRCVPEIIGFSNRLSYDFKIKPLRDASSSLLLPAVVNYRVDGGKREGKENPKEALTIVALLMASMKQPEYDGKTFGVISLLGDEQANKIQNLIFEHIDAKDIERRRILCGNASNFQGDERDVVFLSVVDSGNGYGPLPKQEFGPDDAYRKRYNVAASRARDQIWIVDSLDAANDLKPGDIRKRLIDYSLNPAAFENVSAEIEKKSESPFEAAVARTLASRGYHLVQQWKVGAYRLDMVAVCGKKNVVIECDGERYHSGEAKIREDMERQTILERLGWRFIRIRGSEYFRNPEKAMERVFTELDHYGIEQEAQTIAPTETRTSELLQRTTALAEEILNSFDSSGPAAVDIETIGAALSNHGTETPVIREAPKNTPNTEESKNIKNDDQVPEQLVFNLGRAVSPRQKSPSRQAAKRSITNATKSASHYTPAVQPRSSSKPAEGDNFIAELKNEGIAFVDNREQSGIVWVLYSAEVKATVETLSNKHQCKLGLEKRGSIATNNRPAWRVVF
ncbi:AAA domain-containing protein [uncultured Oscillibacter sp.]|uniref:AAA domain-containing protein n=1 Tax=uncultured Oscillibacter sp. TaxID=876091 RepID=UPI0025ECA345|nr:AAA domain-containing protein [uncultured Oscillibacter sp.]